MHRPQRILIGAVTVTALLVAARPAADMVRSMPDVALMAVPQNASALDSAGSVDRSERASRNEVRRQVIQGQEIRAQELEATAQDRSQVLADQVTSIEQQGQTMKKAAAKEEAVKQAAAKKKAAAAKAAKEKARQAADAQAKKAAAAQKRSAAGSKSRSTSKAKSRSSSTPKSSSGAVSAPSGSPKAIARSMMQSSYGWGESEFGCYNKIITQESGWDPRAKNPSSGAYGIPQSLPGSKMATAGSDWRTNPATQIKWSLGYIKDRYGTPCKAWSFKQGTGWY